MSDRRVVLRDVHGVGKLVGIQPEQPRAGDRGAERAPGARGVVVDLAFVLFDADPDRDLVADQRSPATTRAGRPAALCRGQRSGDHDRPRVPLRDAVAVVEVQGVGEHPVGARRARCRQPAAVEQRSRVVARVGRRCEVGGDRADGSARAATDTVARSSSSHASRRCTAAGTSAHAARARTPTAMLGGGRRRGGARPAQPPSVTLAGRSPRSAAPSSPAADTSARRPGRHPPRTGTWGPTR